jgi:hypothetical protein
MNTLEVYAATLANNHARFESFGWYGRPADAPLWGIYYTHNRDSSALDRSNAAVMADLFAPYVASGDMRVEEHNHWACGWIAGYAVRVYRSDGTLTEAVRALYGVLERLDDYPVLNEDAWSALEDTEAYDAGCYFCGHPADAHKHYTTVGDLGDGCAYVHAACARLAAMRGDRDGIRAWREVRENMRDSA